MKYDRTRRNNMTDGQIFYGVDNDEGDTDWYNESGDYEGTTRTPTDDEQAQNEAGY